MDILKRVIMAAILLFSSAVNLAISGAFLRVTNHALDGSFQFWLITIVSIIASMSLFINALQSLKQ